MELGKTSTLRRRAPRPWAPAKVLTGRVVFTPRATGAEWAVEYAAECSLGKLVNGVLVPKAVVAPTGFEPVFESRPYATSDIFEFGWFGGT